MEHGLGEKGENNFKLAQQSCNSLLKLVPLKLKQVLLWRREDGVVVSRRGRVV